MTFDDLQKIKNEYQNRGLEEYEERKRIFEDNLM